MGIATGSGILAHDPTLGRGELDLACARYGHSPLPAGAALRGTG